MTRDKKGIVASLANVKRALCTPGWWRRIAWDEFRSEVLWTPWEGVNAGQWTPWGDNDSVRARMALEREGFQPVGRELLRDALGAAAEACTFDSAQTWLSGLEWDGVCRVETFLSEWAGCEDREYVRAVARYWWTAMAGRVLVPSIKADMAVILYGRQGGQGKTTLVESLAYEKDYFGRLNLSSDDANLARALRGKLIVELAELRGLRGRDSEGTKAFVDAKHDEWVPKYKEYAIKAPRRFVIVGTTDKMDFLADSAGNHRRWLPVTVGEEILIPEPWEVAQLWAEAAEMFARGGVAWRDAQRLAREGGDDGDERSGYGATNMVQDVIEEWIGQPVGPEGDASSAGSAGEGGAPGAPGVTWGERGFTTAEVSQWALHVAPGAARSGLEIEIANSLGRLKFTRRKEKRRNAMRDKWAWRRNWGLGPGE